MTFEPSLDDFEKDNYIENNMLVIRFDASKITYYSKNTVMQWEFAIEAIKNKEGYKYCVTCYSGKVAYFNDKFHNIENAKEYVKKLTALIQKLNNN